MSRFFGHVNPPVSLTLEFVNAPAAAARMLWIFIDIYFHACQGFSCFHCCRKYFELQYRIVRFSVEFEMMCSGLPPEAKKTLLKSFVDLANEHMELARAFRTAGDRVELAKEVHFIGSSAAVICRSDLLKLTSELENAILDGADFTQLYDEFELMVSDIVESASSDSGQT